MSSSLVLRTALVALLFASLLGTAFASTFPFASVLRHNTSSIDNHNNNNASAVSLASGDLPNCAYTGSCAGKGDRCNTQAIQYPLTLSCESSPDKSLCCGIGLWCVSGTCVTDNLGDSCSKSTDCYPTMDGTGYANCVNSTCTELYYTGDSCSANSDCISGVCQNSLCKGVEISGLCAGYLSKQVCVQGAYCNGVSCQAAATEGNSCLLTPCQSGLVCASGVCKKIFSLDAAQTCQDNFQCDDDLACVKNTCLAGSDYTAGECSEDSDCKSNSCVCSQTSGKGYCDYGMTATNCFSELEDLSECLDDNNCIYSLDAFSDISPLNYSPYVTVGPNNAPNSCTRKNCRAKYAAVAICKCVMGKASLGNCYNEYYCSKIALWLILVLVAAGVVALCLVCICVVICCRVCRRRKSYAHV